MLNGEIIGVINITGNRFPRPFNIDDQNLLDIAALFIGKSIQVIQLQNVLNSRFAQLALAQQQQQALQQNSAPIRHKIRTSWPLLAKTFFRTDTCRPQLESDHHHRQPKSSASSTAA